MNKDLAYYVALSQSPAIGAKRFKVLVEHFGSAKAVWTAPDKILKEILDPSVFAHFSKFRFGTAPEKLLEGIYKKNIKVLTLLDKNYPERLKQIFDPPPVLYVRGELAPSDKFALAVVGTRKITNYGKEVTELLVKELSSVGLTIVSGLARGVDSLAHKIALENKTRTIAVLGSGVDQIYPPQNEPLAAAIEKNGAVISEYPPGMIALPGNFPARNRIISGLSLGVLVTEAGVDSGSLITAGLALEQNREVFAIPGPIYSQLSKGPSALIKQGAKLVTSAEDVLEELNIKGRVNRLDRQIKGDSKEENLLLKLLENEEKNIDQLIRESKLSTEKLTGLLTTMELTGKIKNLGAGKYSLNY